MYKGTVTRIYYYLLAIINQSPGTGVCGLRRAERWEVPGARARPRRAPQSARASRRAAPVVARSCCNALLCLCFRSTSRTCITGRRLRTLDHHTVIVVQFLLSDHHIVLRISIPVETIAIILLSVDILVHH